MEKISKEKIFTIISIFALCVGKTRIIIYIGYRVGGGLPKPEKVQYFNKGQLKILINFQALDEEFLQICYKTR